MVRATDGTAIPLVLNADRLAYGGRDPAQEVARLYSLHASSLHRYLLLSGSQAADADELLQEGFLRLFRAMSRGESIDNHKAWLVRVLQNLRTDKARRDSLYTEDSQHEVDGRTPLWSSDPPSPEDAVITSERFHRLNQAIRTLSEKQRRHRERKRALRP